MSAAGIIPKLAAIKAFLVAGNAKFTIVSKRSGNRWTFQSRRPANPIDPGHSPFFIDLLVGADNQNDYKYLAFLRSTDFGLRLTVNKEKWGGEAFATLEWLIRQINSFEAANAADALAIQARFNANAEFWHSGRCSKCGRELTDPVSIELGVGPVCGGRS